MTNLRIFVFAFLFACTWSLQAQDTNGYEPLRQIQLDQYNDLYQLFNQSDKNYTDGAAIKVSLPIFNNKVSDFALIGLRNTDFKDFSLSIEQDIYTPENVDTDSLIYDDRPYAGLLYFNYEKVSNNIFNGTRMVSNFQLGIIGPEAFGKQTQNGVHEAIGNNPAQGWDNQLSTGLILDYETYFWKQIKLSNPFIETRVFGRGHIGTLMNFAEAGIKVRTGLFGDSRLNMDGRYNHRNRLKSFYTVSEFDRISAAVKNTIPKRLRKQSIETQVAYLNSRYKKKFQVYIHAEIRGQAILYDGTINGSLIPFEKSAYNSDQLDYNHFELIAEYGFHIQYSRFFLNTDRVLENDIASPGEIFGYGQVEMGFIF